MKEPSIHITRTALTALLKEYDTRHSIGVRIDPLVQYLLSKGRLYQIDKRIPLASFKKDVKKVIEGTMSSQEDTSLMAQTIYYIRWKDNKFKAGALIKDGDIAWKKTKEVAVLANRFCEAFELKKTEGYKKYINIYMMLKTKSFSLQAINSKHDYIVDTYEAQLRLEDTEYKADIERAHEYYQRKIYENTGQQWDLRLNPVKYACFIDGIVQAREMNITPEDYVEAGFDQLSWKSGIPTVTGFGTEMYRNRVITWMSETEHKTADNQDVEDRYREMLKKANQDDRDNS